MQYTRPEQSNKLPQNEDNDTSRATEIAKPSNLSIKSPRRQERKNVDWPYKNIRFNEQVAVYEVPGYDESRFMQYGDYEPDRESSYCCTIQ